MTTPRKSPTAAAPMNAPANSEASPSQDVGDAPGSPAYFGKPDAEQNAFANAAADYETVPDTGAGSPPGGADYWGVDAATHAASRGPDGAELPLPTVGEPPGGPSYFGTGEA